jgi:hypothetical protein
MAAAVKRFHPASELNVLLYFYNNVPNNISVRIFILPRYVPFWLTYYVELLCDGFMTGASYFFQRPVFTVY